MTTERPTAREALRLWYTDDADKAMEKLAEHGYAVVSVTLDDLARAVQAMQDRVVSNSRTPIHFYDRVQMLEAALLALGVDVREGTQ